VITGCGATTFARIRRGVVADVEPKFRLAREHRHYRLACTDAKTPFIERSLRTAEEWATEVVWRR
jgi:hypothetical protein